MKNGINVLSLFDGMSCGQIALERIGVKVNQYYASEIDKYAIKVTQHNYPNTIHLGSVVDVSAMVLPDIDLLLGGSPCQGFSFAGKQLNFDDPRSKLFFEYVRILKELREHNPNIFFLLENVKMKKESQDVISELLGVEPIVINSALVSAQNRKRLYWTNIKVDDANLGAADINLSDILLDDPSPTLWLSQNERNYMDREVSDGRTHWDFMHHSDTYNLKSACIVTNFCKGVPYNVLIDRRGNRCSMWSCDFQNSYDMCDSCEECDSYQGENYPSPAVRKFDPIECERLQTVPDNYTACVSNSQRYKMLGNGWTVETVAHIFSYLPYAL